MKYLQSDLEQGEYLCLAGWIDAGSAPPWASLPENYYIESTVKVLL